MDIEDHSMRPAQFAELQRLNQLHREKLRQIAERKGLSSVPGQPDIIPSKVAERSRRTRLEQGISGFPSSLYAVELMLERREMCGY